MQNCELVTKVINHIRIYQSSGRILEMEDGLLIVGSAIVGIVLGTYYIVVSRTDK
jgi:hypothetical protein